MSGTGWVVTGTEIEAVVARFDPANPDAVAYLQHHFRSFGIDKLLRRAGVKTGEEVHIGGATFDYLDDTARADQMAEDIQTSTEELGAPVEELGGSAEDLPASAEPDTAIADEDV